jgi:hypothetical protein
MKEEGKKFEDTFMGKHITEVNGDEDFFKRNNRRILRYIK